MSRSQRSSASGRRGGGSTKSPKVGFSFRPDRVDNGRAVKGLRIGRRRARANGLPSSPLELALVPALADERWRVPDRFNFTRDVVEVLAGDPKRRALTFLGSDGVIEPVAAILKLSMPKMKAIPEI